jgi:hypothetical protein
MPSDFDKMFKKDKKNVKFKYLSRNLLVNSSICSVVLNPLANNCLMTIFLAVGSDHRLWSRIRHIVSYFFCVNTLPRIVVITCHLIFGYIVKVFTPDFFHFSECRLSWLVSSICHFYYLFCYLFN